MSLLSYEGFAVLTILMLALDLYQTRGGKVTIKKAAVWSVFWVILALAFNVVIYLYWPLMAPESSYTNSEAATAFLTGYLLEKSLSVDNLFVFALIFSQFVVPEAIRPRVLMLGVVGALILRAIMIAVGAELLTQFHWILYVFAAFLLYTGYKLWREDEEEQEDFSQSLPVRMVKKCFRVSDEYRDHKFFVKDNKGWIATPLLIVIAVIALTDVMFALDSIPAIFAVTKEPFMVMTANVFALLGLRSLYFVLEGMLTRFCYLRPALAFILSFIGIKMLLMETSYAIPTPVSLGVIVLTISTAIIGSLWKTRELKVS
ncbi:TerC family protein [Photobacterium sp. ZSDE20]|uniref:TerC family protein n=1 Tax=Photobacterium pectinilyticum TaxID=2906793 RepID=A0ABT1N949_9GAMM|nr:TerC family protein [Photobacterium sp. ZSDE20]MCQ1061270.1 TerC family protein [Photobacterium sp. ZSDE20]MDD1829750.1 TerC family protein [Photobacterium sp. ZSDE20]